MKFPFSLSLRVDEMKVVGYLLSQPNSHGKAAFFLCFGFESGAWTVLASALKQQALSNPVVVAVDSPYGTRYSIDGELQTPSGRCPKVRTVWIHAHGSDELRLITAHPV